MKANSSSEKPSETLSRHSRLDDVQAIVVGSVLASFAVAMFTHTHTLVGGTVGLSFLAQYATGWSFGAIFFVLNVPFYILGVKQFGRAFAIKTFLCVLLVSILSEWIPQLFTFTDINPWFASILGGLLMGNALLMFFRHKASLGGLNILVIYLQERHQLSAGKLQMAIDCLIVAGALLVVDVRAVFFSIIAAITLNTVLAINHKPGRYRVMS